LKRSREVSAATHIQAKVRGTLARKKVSELRAEKERRENAATTIQSIVRMQSAKNERRRRADAAGVMQRVAELEEKKLEVSAQDGVEQERQMQEEAEPMEQPTAEGSVDQNVREVDAEGDGVAEQVDRGLEGQSGLERGVVLIDLDNAYNARVRDYQENLREDDEFIARREKDVYEWKVAYDVAKSRWWRTDKEQEDIRWYESEDCKNIVERLEKRKESRQQLQKSFERFQEKHRAYREKVARGEVEPAAVLRRLNDQEDWYFDPRLYQNSEDTNVA